MTHIQEESVDEVIATVQGPLKQQPHLMGENCFSYRVVANTNIQKRIKRKKAVSSFSILLLCLLPAALILKGSDAFSFQPSHQHPLCNTRTSLRMLTTHGNKANNNAKGVVFPSSSSLFQAPLKRPETFLASTEGDQDDTPSVKPPKAGFGTRVGSYFKSSEADDGLTFRQRLAKMGLATVLSYGWISNTNAMILVSAAWYAFSAKTGMSPLYPGQWKNFLGVYAGFYVISNFLRPFRVTLAVAIGPYFDRFVNWIQRKTKLPKAAAITCTVLLVNLGGTLLLMVGGISAASLLSGVPVFAPKA